MTDATPQGRPPSAELKFLSRGPFTAEHIARLYWMLTGQETSEAELEDIRRALEEDTTNEEETP